MNEIYLKYIADEFIEFDQDQENTLINIAYQNPISGGDAVYDARVLLGIELDDFYENTESQERFGRSSSIVDSTADNETVLGKIIPNPNNGTMQFLYKLNESQNANLEIYDTKGHQLKRYQLKSLESTQNIEMTDFAAGIYFYRFTIGGQIIRSDKILIEK